MGEEAGSLGFFEESGNTQGRLIIYNINSQGDVLSQMIIAPQSMQILSDNGGVTMRLNPDGTSYINFKGLPTTSINLP